MEKQTTKGTEPSRVIWDHLEEWVRAKVQEFIQSLMEEEITELLGRQKSERREAVDSPPVYRNGHGKARHLTLGYGTITVYRPRVRGLEQRFESRVVPMFARRTAEINKLIPELYLHGLAMGDLDLALRGLLGEAAPISARQSPALRKAGRSSGKNGRSAVWTGWKYSSCGRMASMSRRVWRKRKPPSW